MVNLNSGTVFKMSINQQYQYINIFLSNIQINLYYLELKE